MRSLFVSLPLTTLLLLLVVVQSCAPNKESQQALESSIPENVELNVSLGSSSRAERFLGTFDEIDRLTLDLVRNFDNREVVSGFALSRDNDTGRWTGTLNNLIVSFEYTVTGHAYKIDNSSDNVTALEIFRGETQHTVTSGTNSLALRLTPLLDNRELSVPRITRINRPFQLGEDGQRDHFGFCHQLRPAAPAVPLPLGRRQHLASAFRG